MDHSTGTPRQQSSRVGARGWILSIVVVGLAAATCSVLVWSMGRDSRLEREHRERSEHRLEQPPEPSAVDPLPPVEKPDLRSELLGTWSFDDGISRTIVIGADGQAAMHVQLDPISEFLFGKELDLEIEWTLVDDLLTYRLIGGRPADKVQRLIAAFGDRQEYRILERNPDDVLLELLSDRTQTRWKRVQP
jgi:hypothetical protein